VDLLIACSGRISVRIGANVRVLATRGKLRQLVTIKSDSERNCGGHRLWATQRVDRAAANAMNTNAAAASQKRTRMPEYVVCAKATFLLIRRRVFILS